jgi:shikimate dehydrogenase
VGIIGDPVGHSLSPALHNAAFAALGLDWVYVPLPVRREEVGAAVEGLRALGLRGANVTVPHKAAVLPYLDRVEGDAALVEAVNTITVDGPDLVGHNTDVEGVRGALEDACGDDLRGAPGLVLGAGGAARAVALALVRMGVRLTVVNRTAAAAERLAALITAAVPAAECRWLPLEALDGELVGAQSIVANATSLGMAGAGKVPALLADNLSARQVAFDVVYAPDETRFLVRARARQATVVGGLEMLVRQAAAAFELWTDRTAPLDVMRDAIHER